MNILGGQNTESVNNRELYFSGRNTTLLPHEEMRLADYLTHAGRIGYGVLKKHVPILVKEILDDHDAKFPDSPREKCFTNNMPSLSWVSKFLARHPNLTLPTPEKMGFQRTYISEDRIREWFDELANFLLLEHKIDANLFLSEENAHRIFNADESGFPLGESTGTSTDLESNKF